MIVLVFVAGMLLGSLLNVAIIRIPREERLLGWPRCTRTGESLVWWQLLPVVGWAVQRGRASDGRPLNWIYPLIELLTATVMTLLWNRYSFSPLFFYLACICSVLIVTGAIDWLYRYIYTFVILGGVLVALVVGPIVQYASLLAAVIGAIVAGLMFVLFYALGRVLFRGVAVPFGLGDVYLAIFIGAIVGVTQLGPTLLAGILLAGAVSAFILIAKALRLPNMPTYISYGTYLCLGAIFYIVFKGR